MSGDSHPPEPAAASPAMQRAAAALAAAQYTGTRDGWITREFLDSLPPPPAAMVHTWAERLRSIDAESAGFAVALAGEARYPTPLMDLPSPPAALFVTGDPSAVTRPAVAVVGSRTAPPDYLAYARDIAAALAQAGVVVVSGMAAGVDTAAHLGALEAGGTTVAVAGTGLGVVFPPQNEALHDRIIESGAVVSQFPPGQQPTRTSFLARNALIAALGAASVAITPAARSGTRNEINHAVGLGRPVMLSGEGLRGQRWVDELVGSGAAHIVGGIDEILHRCGLWPSRS